MRYILQHVDNRSITTYRSWNEREGHHWQPFISNAAIYDREEAMTLVASFIPDLEPGTELTIKAYEN